MTIEKDKIISIQQDFWQVSDKATPHFSASIWRFHHSINHLQLRPFKAKHGDTVE